MDQACRAAGVSRAGYYRQWTAHQPLQADTELRDRIQQICLEHRQYGSRRVGQVLRGEGRLINRKRVRRLIREDKLLALRKRRYVIATDSRHTYAVCSNRPCTPDKIVSPANGGRTQHPASRRCVIKCSIDKR